MGVESFDAGALPADLVDKLTKLESAAVMPPELIASLSVLESAMVLPAALREALDGLQAELRQRSELAPATGTEGPFARQLRVRRLVDLVDLAERHQQTNRTEALAGVRAMLSESAMQGQAMAALAGLQGERKRVAAALSAPGEPTEFEVRDYCALTQPPAPAQAQYLAPPAALPSPAPAPASHVIGAASWTDERIAQRLDQLKTERPKRAAPMVDLLAELGWEDDEKGAARRRVQRIVNKLKPGASRPVSSVFDLAARPRRRA